MILLLLSFLPLLLGSFLVQALFNRPRLIPMLDGFVLVSVGGIVFLHILPDAIVHGGWPAAAAALFGMVLPFFFERRLASKEKGFSGIALLALCGLGIHGMLDGVALAAGDVGAENGGDHGAWRRHTSTPRGPRNPGVLTGATRNSGGAGVSHHGA